MALINDTSLESLKRNYASGTSPIDLISVLLEKIERDRSRNIWIHVESFARLVEACKAIEGRRQRSDDLPLYGIPFGVKDNIDVEGMPTTAACPAYSHIAKQSAHAVQRLIDQGAICLGKTNLDQFATGLSGARSAYGACGAYLNPAYVSGGSSSGSALAVVAGHVSFALGTDTGGSGRIPAGFNGIVGIKPTVGRISTRGLVANCRSLDCVSIFSNTVSDGMIILKAIEGFDLEDPYCRKPPSPPTKHQEIGTRPFSFGRLNQKDLEFFGMEECAGLYESACARLVQLGGQPTFVNFSMFAEAGQMMFGGPWIAERRSALEPFTTQNPDEILPVISQVLNAADQFSAVDAFNAMYRLALLKREADQIFSALPFLVVPTAPRPFTLDEMNANPIDLNNCLGHYSYFANLLDLSAIAVPNDVLKCGVPMGVTFLGPAWCDESLAGLAMRFESQTRVLSIAS